MYVKGNYAGDDFNTTRARTGRGDKASEFHGWKGNGTYVGGCRRASSKHLRENKRKPKARVVGAGTDRKSRNLGQVVFWNRIALSRLERSKFKGVGDADPRRQ